MFWPFCSRSRAVGFLGNGIGVPGAPVFFSFLGHPQRGKFGGPTCCLARRGLWLVYGGLEGYGVMGLLRLLCPKGGKKNQDWLGCFIVLHDFIYVRWKGVFILPNNFLYGADKLFVAEMSMMRALEYY